MALCLRCAAAIPGGRPGTRMEADVNELRRDPPADVPATALADAVRTAPQLVDPDRARAMLAAWLDEIADPALRAALDHRLPPDTPARRLIEGLADGSPYLWDLVRADAPRLLRLLEADPAPHLAALLADASAAVLAARSEAEAMRLLRRMKAEAALLIALADIGGVWPVMRVTQALTELADTAVSAAVRYLLRDAADRGKFTPPDPARPDLGSGYIVLAMGKMGAFELNYSSDIDLIVLFDPARAPVPAGVEPAPLFIRITRNLVKLLQERTADGYVFRTDLRLRPDPASTQVAIAVDAAMVYYETVGQNWERAAMIKARPCAGDIAAGDAFLQEVAPFVWRKYLDFAAVTEVHALKRQMHAFKGHEEIAVEGHNIKLGRGGIREIEFFAQTQQLIAGGRYPVLRGRETLATLAALVEGNWISAETAADLDAAYRYLRTVEHRLQMVADEQTHTLPTDPEVLERFVRFLGYENRDAFAAALLHHLRIVQRHYAALFEEAPAAVRETRFVFPPDHEDRATLDHLAACGFAKPLEAAATVRRWLGGEYRALRGELARSELQELVPLLLEQFARTDNPPAVLAAFDNFLERLHGGSRLLSLLRQNPDLVSLLAMILGVAPRLADIVANHPQVMDGLIDPAFFGPLPDESKLAARLAETLAQAVSYEDLLDRARIFGREQRFLIGARILSGTVSAAQAGEAFARLADVLIRALHQAVETQLAEAHGRLAGQQSAVLALGKLGSSEMSAGSDLDLLLIYDFDQERPESDGKRPLYGSQYFARLTQRLVSALTAQTNYGALYQVDMRLRPSGRSGPVATRLDGFRLYQENEAWTWEHMALTRARVVSASPDFAARIDAVIREVLCRPRDRAQTTGDIVEMRQAIATEKGEDNPWDLKYAAGGLIDVEFIAQYLQLQHAATYPEILDRSTGRALEKAARLGLLTPEDAETVRTAVRLYGDLTQILRLCLNGPFDPKNASPQLLGLLARAADLPDFATLDAYLREIEVKVRVIFHRLLSRAVPVGARGSLVRRRRGVKDVGRRRPGEEADPR